MTIGDAALRDLRAAVRGQVLMPGDAATTPPGTSSTR